MTEDDTNPLPPDKAALTPEQVTLTPKEVAAAKAEAATLVAKEMKDKAKKQLVAEEKARLTRELAHTQDAGKELVSITIDLAPYADRITKNSGMAGERVFMHGRTYDVTREVANTLLDDCSKTWRHQAEVDGKGLNFYRERQSVVSGKNGSVSYSNVEGLRL